MEAAVSRYVSGAAGEDDRKRELATIIELISSGNTSLLGFVQQLGDYITANDSQLRARAMEMLQEVITHVPKKHLTGQHVSTMTQFFADRLSDVVCMKDTLTALLSLSRLPLFSDDDAAIVIDGLCGISEEAKQYPQRTRHQVYIVWDSLMERRRKQLKRQGNQVAVALKTIMSGEKDPRNLMLAFSCMRVVLTEFERLDDVEGLFDAVYCYFPITFRSSPDDPSAISTDDLKVRLRQCLTSTELFAPMLIPALLEKLNAVAHSVKKDAMQTLSAATVTYADVTLDPYARQLWDAIKFEIIQAEDDILEDVALECLTDITKCLSRGATDMPRDGPMASWLKTVSREVVDQLREPELKSAKPCGKIIKAVAIASPLCWKVLAQACLPVLIAMIEEANTLNKRTSLIDVLMRILQGEKQVRDADVTQPELSNVKDEILQLVRQNLLSVAITEHEHRLIVLACIDLLLDRDNCLTTKDRELLVGDVTNIVLEEKTEVAEQALTYLSQFAAQQPTMILDKAFPALLGQLPNDNIISKEQLVDARHSLDALAQLTVERVTFQTLVTRILSRLDSFLSSPEELSSSEYALDLLRALLQVERRLSESDPDVLATVGQRLVPELFQRVILSTYPGHAVLREPAAVQVLAEMVNLVVRVSDGDLQRDYAMAVMSLYITGGVSWLLKQEAEEDFKPFTDEPRDKGQWNTLPLFTAVYAGLRPDIELVGKINNNMLAKCVVLAGVVDSSAAKEALGQLAALIVNKAAADAAFDEAVSQIKANANAQGDLDMLSWIVKALVLRNHKAAADLVKVLCAGLDDAETAQAAAVALQRIAEDDVILSKHNHATVKSLHKQKFFATVMPELTGRVRAAAAAGGSGAGLQKGAIVAAGCGVVANVPKSVYMSQLGEVMPILLSGLASEDGKTKFTSIRAILGLGYEGKDVLSEHLSTLVPALLAALSVSAKENTVRVRVAALRLLGSLVDILRRDQIQPVRQRTIDGLAIALDDPKRIVRKEAVSARHKWYQI